jgi:hypothetical protein
LSIAEAPKWLISRLAQTAQKKATRRKKVREETTTDTPRSLAVDDLKIARATRDLIRQGGAPDGHRSLALCAVYRAMDAAGYSDEEIADVVTDPGNGISAKPLGQRDPRGWVLSDIDRVLSKREKGPPEYGDEDVQQQGDTLFAHFSGLFAHGDKHGNNQQNQTLDELFAHNALFAHSVFPELSETALYGLAGDVVRTIEPHTESSSVAILVQFLTAFGASVGRRPHYPVEADWHRVNLFCALIGASSKARKGTSAGHVRKIFHMADADFVTHHWVAGLSSGEGLIWAVRDPIPKREKTQQGGKIQYVEVTYDPNFAQNLRVCERYANVGENRWFENPDDQWEDEDATG